MNDIRLPQPDDVFCVRGDPAQEVAILHVSQSLVFFHGAQNDYLPYAQFAQRFELLRAAAPMTPEQYREDRQAFATAHNEEALPDVEPDVIAWRIFMFNLARASNVLMRSAIPEKGEAGEPSTEVPHDGEAAGAPAVRAAGPRP